MSQLHSKDLTSLDTSSNIFKFLSNQLEDSRLMTPLSITTSFTSLTCLVLLLQLQTEMQQCSPNFGPSTLPPGSKNMPTSSWFTSLMPNGLKVSKPSSSLTQQRLLFQQFMLKLKWRCFNHGTLREKAHPLMFKRYSMKTWLDSLTYYLPSTLHLLMLRKFT